jgi:hypothetical protein
MDFAEEVLMVVKDPRTLAATVVDEWTQGLERVDKVGECGCDINRGPGFEVAQGDVEILKMRIELAIRREEMGSAPTQPRHLVPVGKSE